MIFKALDFILEAETRNVVVPSNNITYDGDFCTFFSDIMFYFLKNYCFATKFDPINQRLLVCITSILLLLYNRSITYWKERMPQS